jgi:hypothetical protein
MAGPLKTLFLALQASTYMSGVSLAFGEEMTRAQEFTLPYVVMVPIGGNHERPGYAMDGSAGVQANGAKPGALDEWIDRTWEIHQRVDFYLWHAQLAGDGSLDPSANPVDHADAVETLRLAVLSALHDQRAMPDANGNAYYGLDWKSLGEHWETAQNAVNRFGRALVVSVQINTPVVMAPPAQGEVVVQTTEFDPSFNDEPS